MNLTWKVMGEVVTNLFGEHIRDYPSMKLVDFSRVIPKESFNIYVEDINWVTIDDIKNWFGKRL